MGSVNEPAAHGRPIFLPPDLSAEWDLIIEARLNVLLIGPPAATDAMLVSLVPRLAEPIQQYKPTAGVPVPQLLEGTLVLLEVAQLNMPQQAEVLQYLDQLDERRVQVVSTTAEPLYSLTETGAFLARLYYRLNIVRIDLTPSGVNIP
jgi:transcriptional regulator of acetoin/glycerol metabolism